MRLIGSSRGFVIGSGIVVVFPEAFDWFLLTEGDGGVN